MAATKAISLPRLEKQDLFFNCHHCGTALVVDRAAAGMTVTCQRCSQPTPVPAPSLARDASPPSPSTAANQVAELRRHLKENESQRTEISGYIKQLSIQLHRWQLRLQTLDERNRELLSEIGRLEGSTGSPPTAA